MKRRFNHSPFVYGITVPNNNQRLKDPYYITLKKDDTIIDAYPNGGGWSASDNKIYEDEEVSHLSLCPPGESPIEIMTGGWRIHRDIDYFGKTYPMWCGKRYGFLYPDEVPEDHIAIPVRVYAWRDKKNPENTVTIFVAQANIVKASSVDEDITMEIIQEYSKLPGFWTDPSSHVLSHDEIYRSVVDLSRFLEQQRTHPVQSAQLITLLESHGFTPVDYVSGFLYHLRLFERDQAAFAHSLSVDRKWFKSMNPSAPSAPYSNKFDKTKNSTRGPLPNEVDQEHWHLLRGVLLLPDISYICRRADLQTDEKEVD